MGDKDEEHEEEEGEEREDERREAAIASTSALQSSFKPTRATQDQLSKLQELHNRRLQIKSKIHKKYRNKTGKSHGGYLKDSDNNDSKTKIQDLGVCNLNSNTNFNNFSACQHNVATQPAQKKHRKLHWGLDTKERWERKANM